MQGLRALAVLLVVAHHRFPDALPGGFVGVDVFFVVSGFLITDRLMREGERTGSIALRRFWAGRVRRLLPAALLTIAVTTVAAALLLPGFVAAQVGWAAVFGALSAANLWFAATAVDYQATEAVGSPLLHLWSLGVEEQVYLLLPLLVVAALAIARRTRRDARRTAILVVGVLAAASFLVAVARTADGAPSAYFLPDGRAWEPLAGGLLALVLRGRDARGGAAVALQWAGLAAITAAALLFAESTRMPGPPALLPVLGTCAVLAAGDPRGLRRVWALAPVQWVGDRSYALYLWHWPVIAFVAVLRPGGGRLAVAGSLLAALLLAAVSYALVEKPLRVRIPLTAPGRVIVAGLSASALVAGIGAVPIASAAARSATEAEQRQEVLAPPTAGLGWPALARGETWAKPPRVVVPDPATAAEDDYRPDCTTSPRSDRLARCTLGDQASDTVVALIGDSHAFQWLPALDALGQAEGWRIESFLQNSCPFNLLPRDVELSGSSRCTTSVRHALGEVRSLGPRAIITSAWRDAYPGKTDEAAAGYLRTWAELPPVPLVVLDDTPAPTRVPTAAECVSLRGAEACGRTRARALGEPDPVRIAAAEAGVPAIATADAFCGPERCPAVIGNLLVYRDDNHVGATYMRTLLPWVEEQVAPAVRDALAGRTRGPSAT